VPLLWQAKTTSQDDTPINERFHNYSKPRRRG